MLTIPTTPELESRLQTVAAKQGLAAPEYVLRLIEGLLPVAEGLEDSQSQRLAAIENLLKVGAATTPRFTTEDLRRNREEDIEMEERRFQRHFGARKHP